MGSARVVRDPLTRDRGRETISLVRVRRFGASSRLIKEKPACPLTDSATQESAVPHTVPARSIPAQPKLSLYGGTGTGRRVTVRDLAKAKREGEKWAMLTAYDALTAGVFDEAGIPVLLVGDSAGNNHLGYENTVPVTVDQLVMLSGAVVRGTKRAMVIGDLPFGSYQSSPAQALETAARFMKEAGVGAVKLEGGRRVLPQVEALVQAGVPVMAHIGLTPQSVNVLGGYRIAGRGRRGGREADLGRQGAAARRRVRDRAGAGPGRTGGPGLAPRSTSPPSASAPGPAPTRRSWSGPTWRG